jgi:thiol-disulfide isomerase/thioredoxin
MVFIVLFIVNHGRFINHVHIIPHVFLSNTQANAQWKNPCQAMAPVFEELAKEYPSAMFVWVNDDERWTEKIVMKIPKVSRQYPIFRFYNRGSVECEVIGADETKLKKEAALRCQSERTSMSSCTLQ